MKIDLSVAALCLVAALGLSIATIRPRTPSRPTQTVPVNKPTDSVSSKSNSVSYKGVHFIFNISLASKVNAETIPASLDGKPSDIWPEHPGFTLVDYPRPRSMPETDPEIRVFPIAKFREAVAIASKEHAKSVVYPPNPQDWTTYFDEEVRVLKALLAAKPPETSVNRFLAKVRGKTPCSAPMPFLPMWEACQAFVGHVRYINFKKGKGVFFLTQLDTETSQVTNAGLEYAFQGIADDGRSYVYAEFSVAAPVLPKGNEPEVVAWDEKNYLLPHQSKAYQQYLRPVLAKLEALPADKFQPNLQLLEQLIASIELQPD
jgi:hypothetical protein